MDDTQELERLRARLAEAKALLEVFAAAADVLAIKSDNELLYVLTSMGFNSPISIEGRALRVADLRAAAELLARWQAEDTHE